MECQLSAIPSPHLTPIKVTSASPPARKSIRALTENHTTYNKWQSAHTLTQAVPWHIWQKPFIAVILERWQWVMFKRGLAERSALRRCGYYRAGSVKASLLGVWERPSRPGADSTNAITVVAVYCGCLAGRGSIQSNFPLKGANCWRKIVCAVAQPWLAGRPSLATANKGEWKDFILGAESKWAREGWMEGGTRKSTVHIKMCCEKRVWNFTQFWKRLLFFQVEREKPGVCENLIELISLYLFPLSFFSPSVCASFVKDQEDL